MEQSIDTNIFKHHTSSDYYFTEAATLEFSDAKKSIGIQVADCLAGFSMRFLKNLSENNSISNIQWKSFCILQQQNILNPALGTLINCPNNIREKAFNYCNLTKLRSFISLAERVVLTYKSIIFRKRGFLIASLEE